MSTRKITIETTNENLGDVLKDLGVATSNYKDNIFVTLEIPDNKYNYEYLSKSDKVINWSIGEFREFEEGRYIPPKPKKEESKSKPKKSTAKEEEVEEKEKPMNFALGYVDPDEGYEGLAKFIEASWRVCKKSPGIIFGTPLFKSVLGKEYENIEKEGNKLDRALLKQVLESYYLGFPYEDALDDTVNKIKVAWKSLPSHQSLTSVSVRLYKNS